MGNYLSRRETLRFVETRARYALLEVSGGSIWLHQGLLKRNNSGHRELSADALQAYRRRILAKHRPSL